MSPSQSRKAAAFILAFLVLVLTMLMLALWPQALLGLSSSDPAYWKK